jgi:hypothetical protein
MRITVDCRCVTGLPMLTKRPAHLVRGYGPDNRIVNDTGAVVASVDLDAETTRVVARPGVA